MLNDEKAMLYDLGAARSPQQQGQMQRLEAKGICLMCHPKNEESPKREPIVYENDSWYVTKNDYPYVGSSVHYLLVPKRHIESPEEFLPEEASELWDAFRWVKINHLVPGGVFLMRFGDTHYNAGSIFHLHAHVIVGGPRKDDGSGEPLVAYIGTKVS